MRNLFITLLLMAGLSMNAQTLSNPNFESWSLGSVYYADTLPVNWWPFSCNTVRPSTDSYQGTYATRIQGWFSCGIAPGVLVNGQAPANYGEFIESGTPFTSKPAFISGYYKYTDVTAGDSAEVTIILKRYNSITMKRDIIAYATQALPPSAVYSLYTVDITDLMPGISPDSIILMFNSSKYYLFDTVTWALPVLYIDRILLPEAPSAIEETSNSLLSSSLYPNPLAEDATLTVEGDISRYRNVSVGIFDASGKEAAHYENINGNTISIKRNKLSKGSYIYRVTGDKSLISIGKMIIQ